MKVSNSNPNNIANNVATTNTGKATAAQNSGGGKKASSAVTADQIKDSTQVKMSSQARDIQKAMELARPSNQVDEAKVARLQKMIDEGSYRVDASALADKMVDEHLLMPS